MCRKPMAPLDILVQRVSRLKRLPYRIIRRGVTAIFPIRLANLLNGILVKKPSEKDKRKEEYVLTDKGLDLIPVLVEMANWSAEHDPDTAAPTAWIALMKAEREKMIRLIRETVQSGGSVFVDERSLLNQVLSSGNFRF